MSKSSQHGSNVPSLDNAVARKLQQFRDQLAKNFSEPLMSWIPKVSPHLQQPEHLRPLVDLLEKVKNKESFRVCIATPPQHCKTVTISHGLVWNFLSNPYQQSAYASYSQDRSDRVSKACQAIASRAGISPEGITNFWGDSHSKVLWTSVGGAFTGEPVTSGGLLVIDDPNKDRREAESPTVQSAQRDWLLDVADSRLHPGASVIINMARWHPNDLTGYAIRELGYKYICLPALDKLDRPLWPEQRPYEFLDSKRRANAYTWASLYQGQPRPRNTQVFGPGTFYTDLPTTGRRVGFGLDLAYTAKTRADWSVLISGTKCGETLYITNLWRQQADISTFKSTIAAHTRPGDSMLWYTGGQEKAIASMLRPAIPGRRLQTLPATTDKLQRALSASEAWEDGKIQLPEQASWLEDLLSEVTAFTGVKDLHDDIVDAMSALWDLLDTPSGAYDKLMRRGMAMQRAPRL